MALEGHANLQSNYLDAFNILCLPTEIQLMVLDRALMQDVQRPPWILTALCVNPSLHAWVQDHYNKIYRSLDASNEEAFKREKREEKLKVKHLEIVAPVMFKAQTITIQNKIETLTLNYSQRIASSYVTLIDPGPLVRTMVKASGRMTRLVFMTHEDIVGNALRVWALVPHSSIIDSFSAVLRLPVAEQGELTGGILYWVWEAREGSVLTWK